MMDFVKDRFGGLLDPFRDVWGFYQGLDPEQQRSALWLALVGARRSWCGWRTRPTATGR
jgi:hypothetical protein